MSQVILLKGHQHTVQSVAFSPSSYLLASCDEEELRFWEIPEGRCIKTITSDECSDMASKYCGDLTAVAFSPSGRSLALGIDSDDIPIILLSAPYGAFIKAFKKKGFLFDLGCDTRAITFSPDGKLIATACRDGEVRLWDVEAGKRTERILETADQKEALSVSFSPDGRYLASGHYDDIVRVWDLTKGGGFLGTWDCSRKIRSYVRDRCPVMFHPNSYLLALPDHEYGDSIELWDVAQGEQIALLKGGESYAIYDLTFSPDGRFLAAGHAKGIIRLWDLTSCECVAVLEEHEDAVSSLAFSHDGRFLASGSDDKTVRVWDLFGEAG